MSLNKYIKKYIKSIDENKDILNKLLTITKLQNQSFYFYIDKDYNSNNRIYIYNLSDYVKKLKKLNDYKNHQLINNIFYTGIIYEYSVYLHLSCKNISIFYYNMEILYKLCSKYNIKNYVNSNQTEGVDINYQYIDNIIPIFVDLMKISYLNIPIKNIIKF